MGVLVRGAALPLGQLASMQRWTHGQAAGSAPPSSARPSSLEAASRAETKLKMEMEDIESNGSDTSTASPREDSASSAAAPEAGTVIIFDWDDCLLCSSAIQHCRWSQKDMLALESAAARVLRAGMALGETMIVTNGTQTWVRESARHFLPGLLPLLSELTVVSAQGLYGAAFPGDTFAWKRKAFELLLTEERHFHAGLNLVVLGDQYPEIVAGQEAAKLIDSTVLKTVKFRDNPTVAELLGELRKVEASLSQIVSCDHAQHQRLMPQGEGEYPASDAAFWRLAAAEGDVMHSACCGPCTVLQQLWRLLMGDHAGCTF